MSQQHASAIGLLGFAPVPEVWFSHRSAWSRLQARRLLTLLLFLLSWPSIGSAETLQTALSRTYRVNPQIQAALDGVKVAAELIPQARAGYLPSLILQGVGERVGYREEERYRYQGTTADIVMDTEETELSATLELVLQVSLYAGGANRANLSAAEAQVAAQIATLDATVSQVLLSTTSAYAAVLLQQALIRLNRDVEEQLKQLQTEAESLFAKRLVTLTDVAQSSASVARAGAQLTSLQAALARAKSNYTALSGGAPDQLKEWPELPSLPKTLEEAKQAAEDTNPALLAARFDVDSARSGVELAKSSLRPSVGLFATYQSAFEQVRAKGTTNGIALNEDNYRLALPYYELTVGVQVNVPLFSGGKNASEVRQASAELNQTSNLMWNTYNQILSQVESQWFALQMAKKRVKLITEEVKSARETLDGFYRQFQNGLSTMKDVLDARQSLDIALEQQLQARHDVFISHATLLQAMGRYTPIGLGLPVESLGAKAYVEKVRYRLFGTNLD